MYILYIYIYFSIYNLYIYIPIYIERDQVQICFYETYCARRLVIKNSKSFG